MPAATSEDLPPYPDESVFSEELLEAKARAHFGESWREVVVYLEGEIASSHITHWPAWRKRMFALACIYLSGPNQEGVAEQVRTLDDDYRTVVWAAEEDPHGWIVWLNAPDAVSKGM